MLEVVGESTAARHPLHVRLHDHYCMPTVTVIERQIEGRMGLRMLEGEGGCDGVVEALHSGCAWSGSRAATRRPTLLPFLLQDAEWKVRRQFGRLWCVLVKKYSRGWVNSGSKEPAKEATESGEGSRQLIF
jgi:transposase